MKRKIICLVLVLAMMVAVFASCGGDPGTPGEHTHSAATEWTSDATGHWHKCTADATCTEKLDFAAHTPVKIADLKPATETEEGLTEGKKCSVCGYIIEAQQTIPKIEEGHVHTYDETKWEHDGEYHWHPATCEHKMDTSILHKEAHTPETVPGTPATEASEGLTEGTRCSTCGYWIKPQETIPQKEHTHVDENNDGRCDICGKSMMSDDGDGEEDEDKWMSHVIWDTRKLIFQLTRNSNNNELSSGCERYLAGEGGYTDTIDRDVTRRNNEAELYTNVDITYKYVADDKDHAWSKNFENIFTEVQSKAKDSPDMYCNFLTDMITASVKGCFANLQSMSRMSDQAKKDALGANEEYVNFFISSSGTAGLGHSGYMADLMSSLTLDIRKTYVVASDYFIDLIRAFFVVPVNIKMFNEIANSKEYSLLEDLNEDGVVNIADFFIDVQNGNWTYDRLAEFSAAVYQNRSDVTGTTEMTLGDKLGFALSHTSGLSASGMVYTTSNVIIQKAWDSTMNNGAGGYRYAYPDTNPGLVNLANKLNWLFQQRGVLSVGNESSYGASSLEAIRNQFAADSVLFGGVVMVGSLEDEVYQQMKSSSGFGVVPVPLYTSYHEAKKYVIEDGKIVDSGLHNGAYDLVDGKYVENADGTGMYDKDRYLTQIHVVGRGGAISTITPSFVQCSAFLQYQSTHSSDILDNYYVYNLTLDALSGEGEMSGNVEMLQYIRENVRTSFDKLFEDAIGFLYNTTDKDSVNNRWHALISTAQYKMTNMEQKYQELIRTKQEYLARLEKEYEKLPD